VLCVPLRRHKCLYVSARNAHPLWLCALPQAEPHRGCLHDLHFSLVLACRSGVVAMVGRGVHVAITLSMLRGHRQVRYLSSETEVAQGVQRRCCKATACNSKVPVTETNI
jgi:hypothetical protein